MARAENPEKVGSMLEHLDELRKRLTRVVLAVAIGFVISIIFYEELWDILRAPYDQIYDQDLQSILPAEPFSVAMRIAGFGGLIIATPYLVAQVWGFVAPALTQKEKRWAVPIVAALSFLFATGVVFAYNVLPRALDVLGGFLEVEYQPTIGQYTTFALRFMAVFGLTFQFPVFLFAAAAMGAISLEQLRKGRRWAVLIIVIVAAAATPTGDAFTLATLAVPLYLLYEVTILIVRLTIRKPKPD